MFDFFTGKIIPSSFKNLMDNNEVVIMNSLYKFNLKYYHCCGDCTKTSNVNLKTSFNQEYTWIESLFDEEGDLLKLSTLDYFHYQHKVVSNHKEIIGLVYPGA